MRAKLRTWMGSWRVWGTVSCLAYMGLVRWQGPFIAAAWPGGLWIAQGLALLTLPFLALIVVDSLVRHVLAPFFTLIEGKKIGDRTAKAKEKSADSLMSCSTAIFSALLIGVLVFPFTVFIQTMARGTDPVSALVSWSQSVGGSWMSPAWWSWWHTGVLFVLFWLPLSFGMWGRKQALDLYDMIAPSTPVVAQTSQETPERPTVLDPGPPVYVRMNEGSRRRRRHRTR